MIGPADELRALLTHPDVATVDAVVTRMRRIDELLPTADGVAWFNKLYLRTTENVLAAVAKGSFEHPAFMEHLDIVFANLYFRALAFALERSKHLPKAWAPLFADRSRPGVAPIQFALAGMNAHINRDLALALVQTWHDLGTRGRSRLKGDFDRVNPILQSTQDEIKQWFATGFVGVVDSAFGRLDDVMANWSVGRAREAGWTNGLLLWEVRDKALLRRAFVANLDHTVGFAGRGLLIPTV